MAVVVAGTDAVVVSVGVVVGVDVVAVDVVGVDIVVAEDAPGRPFAVAGTVLVTVPVIVLVTLVTAPGSFAGFAVPPKNVVGWPLPVIECPASRSGTV
jgi:hypothetical protein